MTYPSALPLYTPTKELSLNGVCRYRIENSRFVLDVQEIANARGAQSLSGSLALEVWALAQPYTGGGFSGYPIISQPLGTLAGQSCFKHLHYILPMMQPAEGSWNLVLMLREWESGNWVTRDYMNFPCRLKAEYQLVLGLEA